MPYRFSRHQTQQRLVGCADLVDTLDRSDRVCEQVHSRVLLLLLLLPLVTSYLTNRRDGIANAIRRNDALINVKNKQWR